MDNPRCIRIFYSEDVAAHARNILQDAGFECYYTEDTFNTVTLDKVGMRRRFRLYIDRDDIPKAGEHLAKKIKKYK